MFTTVVIQTYTPSYNDTSKKYISRDLHVLAVSLNLALFLHFTPFINVCHHTDLQILTLNGASVPISQVRKAVMLVSMIGR